MPPYDPNFGRDPERDPLNVLGRRLAGLGSWLFTPSERQGVGSTPYMPETGMGVPPEEAGRNKALGVGDAQPTWPPRKPTAPTTSRPQGGTVETPATPTGIAPQFKDRPSPLGPDNDPDFMREMARRRADVTPEMKVSFTGESGMGDYSPDRSDHTGYSEQDWSKVANPMAFAAYRERPERRMLDLEAQDPFITERMKYALQAQGQLGAYQGMRDIDRAEMARRSDTFMRAMEASDADYRQTKTALMAKFTGQELATRLAELESDHAAEQERIKTGYGFGEKARNDAFEGIGRR